jgi:hypothetical protein
MYPAWRGAACDWASEARWIAAEAVFFTILKGTRRWQLLRLYGACSLRAKPVAGEHDALFHKPSRTYPSKAADPPFAELRRVM